MMTNEYKFDSTFDIHEHISYQIIQSNDFRLSIEYILLSQ
jgi:hypothetical protein